MAIISIGEADDALFEAGIDVQKIIIGELGRYKGALVLADLPLTMAPIGDGRWVMGDDKLERFVEYSSFDEALRMINAAIQHFSH